MRLTNCQLIEWRIDNNIFCAFLVLAERIQRICIFRNNKHEFLNRIKALLFIGFNSVFDGYIASQHSTTTGKNYYCATTGTGIGEQEAL